MFRQGLADEGFADLKQAMQHFPQPAPKESWLPVLLSRLIDLDSWELHDRWRVLRYVNRALQESNFRHLWRYVARGLYWNLSRAIKRKEWTQALHSFQLLTAYVFQLALSHTPPRANVT